MYSPIPGQIGETRQRSLDDLPVRLSFHGHLTRGGGVPWDVTKKIGATWKHYIRSRGGFWMATAEWDGPTWEKRKIFTEYLLREVRETFGKLRLWEGFLARMIYIEDGQPYERSWGDIINKTKVIYTQIGDDQLTDGGAEDAAGYGTTAWIDYGSPDTNEQSTGWVSEGNYSAHIEIDVNQILNWDCSSLWAAYNTPTTRALSSFWAWDGGGTYRSYNGDSCHLVADAADDGATIDSSLTITAGYEYKSYVRVNVISGTWKVEIYRTDTDASLGSGTNSALGVSTIKATVADTNTYSGGVGVRIYCTSSSGEVYADGAEFWQVSAHGATVDPSFAIDAGTAYQCRVTLKVEAVTGAWRAEIYRTDTGVALVSSDVSAVGQRLIYLSLTDANTYTGDAGLRIYCTGSGEAYADGAVFSEAPRREDTGWYIDTDSAAEYGTIEEVLLEGGRSEGAADKLAETETKKRAWAKTLPPDDLQDLDKSRNTLKLTFYGRVFTLRNQHTLTTGTNTVSAHMTTLLTNQAEFMTPGIIDENDLLFSIDSRAPLRVWEVINDMTLAGDDQGRRWTCGGFDEAKFNYRLADMSVIMHVQNGRYITPTGGRVSPWFLRPGVVYLADMPLGPREALSGNISDDPRAVYMEEVGFSAPDWLAGGSGLFWRRETGRR